MIENGVLKTEGGMGLLWYTKQKLSNSVLRIVFRVPEPTKAGNSGVFIRIPTEPTEPWMPVNKGYEVQIDHSEDDYHRTGVLYSLTKAHGEAGAEGMEHDGDHADRRSHRRDRERRRRSPTTRKAIRCRRRSARRNRTAARAPQPVTSGCRTTTTRTWCCSKKSV